MSGRLRYAELPDAMLSKCVEMMLCYVTEVSGCFKMTHVSVPYVSLTLLLVAHFPHLKSMLTQYPNYAFFAFSNIRWDLASCLWCFVFLLL